MSKRNNVNPNFYYEGDRNHQGEGIVHDEHKRAMNEHSDTRKARGKNFIPGEPPVGQTSKKK